MKLPISVAQIEHADMFSDPLPSADTLARIKQQILALDHQTNVVTKKQGALDALNGWYLRDVSNDQRVRLANELTQAQLRLAEIRDDMEELILAAAEEITARRALAEVTTD